MKLIIDIDVLNPEEVVKTHKGELVGMLAGVMLSKEKKKAKVERAICDEMVKVLGDELPKALREEFIEANVKFTIDDTSQDLK